MNSVLRRLAAAFSLASLALSWPLAFVSAQQQTARTPIAVIGDSQNEGFTGYNVLAPLLTGYEVVGSMCNRSWTVAQLHNGGGPSTSGASCFRNQSAKSYLDSLTTKPKAIIVFAGGNGTDTSAELTSFVNDLKSVAATIIWVGPFYSKNATIQARHAANSQTQNTVLPGLGVYWMDAQSINPSYTYTNDGTHFTQTEYRQIAQQLAPQMLTYLAAINNTNTATNPTVTETAPIQATDSLGRTQEEVNNSLAVQCSDTNPVFPVRLSIGIGGTTEVNGLTEYINLVYRYMTAIVLVVTIVMVTYGGFRYLLAATPLGVSDGKDIIKNGIIGMTLVLGAYVILNTLNPATTILQFTRPPMDITCLNYAASLQAQGAEASYDTNFSGLRNTPVFMRMQNEWDPLNFRNTYALPEKGHNVSSQNHCNETLGNDDCAEGQECVDTLTFLKAINNTNSYTGNNEEQVNSADGAVSQIYQYITSENMAEICSDGNDLYDPCDVNDECKNGMICSVFWKVCIKETGNEAGSPCTADSQCASGLDCVHRERNHDDLSIAKPQMLSVCTKRVPSLRNSDIAAFNNGTLDANKRCDYHRECEDDGAKCTPNRPNTAIRACILDEVVNGAPCALLASAQGTGSSYFPCSGSSGFTCSFCPGTGSRVWTNMSGNDRSSMIGQCKPNESLGQNCAGN